MLLGRNLSSLCRQQALQGFGVLWCIRGKVVVEVDPDFFRAACFDPARPFPEFLIGVVVPIPTLGLVKPHVDSSSVLTSSLGRRGPLHEQKMIPVVRNAA